MGTKSKSIALIFVTLFSASLIVLPYLTAKANSTSDDWSMFRYDPQHTGVTDNVGPLKALELWRFAEGHFDGSFIGSSAAVVNGVVYVGSNYNQAEGKGGNIYALDAFNGERIWNYSTDAPVYSSPAIRDNLLVIGSSDGIIYGLNSKTGAKIWSFATESRLYSSPAIVNGLVYVASWDGNLYALNASYGNIVWSYPTGNSILSSPAVDRNIVYVVSDDQNIYALDASTGSKIWNCSIGYTYSSPSIRDGVLHIGAGRRVLAINASSGDNIWTSQIFSEEKIRGYSSPAIANGVLYIGSYGGGVYAFNASTGAQIWNNRNFSNVYSSPAVANGVVYINSAALNASNGDTIWSFSTGNVINASPIVSNGVVYIASQDGYFYAIGKPINIPLAISIQTILIVFAAVIMITAFYLLLFRRHRKTANHV